MTAINATPAARRAIAALRAERGPVMFVQSAGCCGGTAPMCYPLGEFLTGAGDLLLGDIDGSPYYMDARHYKAFGEPELTLDVEPGFAEGFSLPAADGMHFVVRTAGCAVGRMSGESSPRGADRTTATGHSAWCNDAWLVEPRSRSTG